MSRTSLVGGVVATLTEADPPLAEATIVMEDGLIVDVGAVGRAGEVIDCTGKLILPGFVNAHAHNTEVLYRGLSGGLDHVAWVDRKHALQRALDEPGAEVGAALAALDEHAQVPRVPGHHAPRDEPRLLEPGECPGILIPEPQLDEPLAGQSPSSRGGGGSRP